MTGLSVKHIDIREQGGCLRKSIDVMFELDDRGVMVANTQKLSAISLA